MKIQLSDHFTFGRLLRFTLPSIAMMIFTSIYGVVDGIFVSNFAGKTAFAAVNLIYPYLMMFGAFGFMIGTGGTALVSMTMLVYVCLFGGAVLTVLSMVLLRPAAILLGATGQMLEDCVTYGMIIQTVTIACVLQFAFQSFCVAAEKPALALWMTVGSGVCNILLDTLFVVILRWGLVGACIPIIYFARPNSSLLRLGRCRFDGRALLRACANGSSELMSNISMSLVCMLYNLQLMKYAGEDGVAAYGAILYVNFIFISLFIGFAIGSAPIVGYHHGAQNHGELKNILRKSLVILGVIGAIMTVVAELLASPLSRLFVGYDESLAKMTLWGFRIYTLSYLLGGVNLFGSSCFTALNNGLISALISFLRTLVFQIAAVMLLPLIFGLDGIWWSIVVAELVALMLTAGCLVAFRKRYHYA